MEPNHINTLGLCLDIVGVILVFWNGLPPTDANPHGLVFMAYEQENPEAVKNWHRRRRYSIAGLTCIVLGFGLQILSNHVCALAVFLYTSQ